MKHRNILVTFIGLIVFFISLVLSLSVLQTKTNNSNAASGVTLSFKPDTTQTSPLHFHIGDTVQPQIYIDPALFTTGSITIEVQYDPNILSPVFTSGQPGTVFTPQRFFSPPNAPFATTIQVAPGATINTTSGIIRFDVTVGACSTCVIQNPVSIGTLNFQAVALTTTTPSLVQYTPQTCVYYINSPYGTTPTPTDINTCNISVLSPLYISVDPLPTSTPTPGQIDTIPPTVVISSSLNSSSARHGSTVTINATASDNVGVTKVLFYVNNVLLATDTLAPYTATWSVSGKRNVTYSLSATAYDAAGNSATSSMNVVSK